MLKEILDLFLLALCNLDNTLKIRLEKLLGSALMTLDLNRQNKVEDKTCLLYTSDAADE